MSVPHFLFAILFPLFPLFSSISLCFLCFSIFLHLLCSSLQFPVFIF